MPQDFVSKRPDRLEYVGCECLIPELDHVGWARATRASGQLGAHMHAHAYELCYIVKGSVEWWAGQSAHEVRGGQIYLTRPGEPHGGADALLHPCELYWIQVRPDVGGRVGRLLSACHQWRVFDADRRVPEIIEQMLREHAAARPGRHVMVRGLLAEVLVLAVRAHEEQSARAMKPGVSPQRPITSAPIQAALDWMESHWREEYQIADLARRVGLGPSQFHALFVRQTGFSPAELRLRRRLHDARRLLRESTLPVTTIAYRAGFSSSQYFATAFRRATGVTPGAYRRRRSGNAREAFHASTFASG